MAEITQVCDEGDGQGRGTRVGGYVGLGFPPSLSPLLVHSVGGREQKEPDDEDEDETRGWFDDWYDYIRWTF